MNTMTTSFLKAGIMALALTAFFGTNLAFAQTATDPSFEVFRIRCQIDIDIDPATGLEEPKVQIQVKVRAEFLEFVDIWVTKYPSGGPSPMISTSFDLGSASADWDTFPDLLDPDTVAIIPGNFVVDGDQIQAHATDTTLGYSGQQVTDVDKCAEKTSSQFRQQTQDVCKLKDFNRNKCKSGDMLPDGTIMP